MNDGAYKYDYLFLVFSGKKGYVQLPLCEVINGDIKSLPTQENDSYIIMIPQYDEKGKVVGEVREVVKTHEQLRSVFESALGMGKLQDFVLQPAGQNETDQVVNFKTEHSKE